MMRFVLAALVGVLCLHVSWAGLEAQPAGQAVLEDFTAKDADGFPKEWKAQHGEGKARQSHTVQLDGTQPFLAVRKADQRIYKRNISWAPKAMPVLTWRWRLKAAPAGAEPIAAVFVSLDTDLMVIPVSNKYVWSSTKAKGTTTEGGMFGASEIILRSGPQPIGEWIEERVNVYEDFKRIHQHEPADKAWGISLQGGPGVEVDFGSLTVSSH